MTNACSQSFSIEDGEKSACCLKMIQAVSRCCTRASKAPCPILNWQAWQVGSRMREFMPFSSFGDSVPFKADCKALEKACAHDMLTAWPGRPGGKRLHDGAAATTALAPGHTCTPADLSKLGDSCARTCVACRTLISKNPALTKFCNLTIKAGDNCSAAMGRAAQVMAQLCHMAQDVCQDYVALQGTV